MKRRVFGGDGIATYVTVLVLVVSVLLNVLLAGRAAKTEQEEVVRADTIVVRDTLRIVETRVVKEEVVRYDTVFFPVYKELDSISNLSKDSAKVVVPITERIYEDSTYKAVVRGYNPELVSLDIYRQQTTVYRQQTRKPKVVVGIGPYAGFGNKGFNYGIAVNVSMPIWSW